MAAAAIMEGVGMLSNILASIFGSRAQVKALKRARGMIDESYGAAEEEVMPWRESGAKALEMLTQMTLQGPGELTDDPGYKFELEEGIKSAQRGAGAKGQLGTGAFAKRLTEYGQGLASTRYNDFFNRYRARLSDLGSLSETGYSAASQRAGYQAESGRLRADLQTGIGQARASGYTGIANSITGGLRSYQANQYADKYRRPAAGRML